jgi:hypothetical protein
VIFYQNMPNLHNGYITMSSLTYIRFFLWNFSFSRFIQIIQNRHILIKDLI